MKKPIALWVAPPLLVLKSIASFYMAFHIGMEPRYQRNATIVAAIFATLAVLLYCKPRIGRWPVGAYYFLATWLGLGVLGKDSPSLKDVAVGLVSAILAGWLSYAFLGSKKMKAYLDRSPEPIQTTTANDLHTD